MGSVVSVAVAVENTKEELARSHRVSTQSTVSESNEQDQAQGDPSSGGAVIAQPSSAFATLPSRAEIDQERAGPGGRVLASSGISGDMQKQSNKIKGVRPPYATVQRPLAGVVVGNANEGLGDDDRKENGLGATDGPQKLSVSSEQAAVLAGSSPQDGVSSVAMQPQRPNGFKPSKLQEGRSRMFSLGRSGAQDTTNGSGGGDGIAIVGAAASVEPALLSPCVGNGHTVPLSVAGLPELVASANREPDRGASSTSMVVGLSDPDTMASIAPTSATCPTTQTEKTQERRHGISQNTCDDVAAGGGGDRTAESGLGRPETIIVDDGIGTHGEAGGVYAVILGSLGGESLKQQGKHADMEQNALIEIGSLSTRSQVEEYADDAFEADTVASLLP